MSPVDEGGREGCVQGQETREEEGRGAKKEAPTHSLPSPPPLAPSRLDGRSNGGEKRTEGERTVEKRLRG